MTPGPASPDAATAGRLARGLRPWHLSAVGIVLAILLGLWTAALSPSMTYEEEALDPRAPLGTLLAVTGLVAALAWWSRRRMRADGDAPPRWAQLAVVAGTALTWPPMLLAPSDDWPAWPLVAVFALGAVLLAAGTAGWRSLHAVPAMVAVSWVFGGLFCLWLVLWEGPHFTGTVCIGGMDCIGRRTPPENATELAFVFFPLMVLPAGAQTFVLAATAICLRLRAALR